VILIFLLMIVTACRCAPAFRKTVPPPSSVASNNEDGVGMFLRNAGASLSGHRGS